MTLTPFPYSAPREGTDRLTPPGGKPGASSQGRGRQSGREGSQSPRGSLQSRAPASPALPITPPCSGEALHTQRQMFPLPECASQTHPHLTGEGTPRSQSGLLPPWPSALNSQVHPVSELPGGWMPREVPLDKTACGCAPISAVGGGAPTSTRGQGRSPQGHQPVHSQQPRWGPVSPTRASL